MTKFSDNLSLEDVRVQLENFANDRDWKQYHSPRNLLFAVLSELGELSEIIRWDGDNKESPSPERKQEWEDEIADVFMLLVRLADRSGVDLTKAYEKKLEKVKIKYPCE